jgi:hypothetical protein
MNHIYNDGGRLAAGFKGRAHDCVTRAVAIASAQPYLEVYNQLNHAVRSSRADKKSSGASARNGVNTAQKWFKNLMVEWGFIWTPTMTVGSGCRIHLRPDELPAGRLVVSLSRHYAAVIDGVVHDTHDPGRGGTRCVYGYWTYKVG